MKKCCKKCYHGECVFERLDIYRCIPTHKIRRGNKERKCPLFWASKSW